MGKDYQSKAKSWQLKVMGWAVRFYLFLGVLFYLAAAGIYILEHIEYPALPFWGTLLVLFKAQFTSWLLLPNWFGKILAICGGIWLHTMAYKRLRVLGFKK